MRKTSGKPRLTGATTAFGVVASLLLFVLSQAASAQADGEVSISSPRDGEALTGVVEVRGTVSMAQFLSADLAFTYADEPGDQWFGITELSQPVSDAQLALWDTTVISDGAYRLRLRLNGTDGTIRDAVIRVEIHNYTSATTPTASATTTSEPVLQLETPVVIASTPTVVRMPAETPTPFPANPAGLTRRDVLAGLVRGGLAVLAVFLLWGAVMLRRRP